MKTIWKFELDIRDEQAIEVPLGAETLTAQIQNDALCLWAIVDSSAAKMRLYVRIVGTGNPVPSDLDSYRYLATVQDGPFVWHVFVSA